MLWDKKEGFSCELKAGPVTRSRVWEELSLPCCGRSTAEHVPDLVLWLQKEWENPGEGESGVLLKAQFEAVSLPMAAAVVGR